MQQVSNKQRLEWLDAMRGFTMILVVAYHVMLIGMKFQIKDSTSMAFFLLFRMPLFFFISGFLAYKPDINWTGGKLSMMIWKKIKIQMIPTIVFLLVATCLLRKNFSDGLTTALRDPSKGGYWFTWALLWMFIIYYVFDFLQSKLIRKGHGIPWLMIMLWIAGVAVYATLYMPAWFSYAYSTKGYGNHFLNHTSLIKIMEYFQFFIFGNLVRRYWQGVQRLFDSKWFFPVLSLLAFICCAEFLKLHNLRGQWANLPRTLAMYSMLLVVIIAFRHYQEHFTKQKPVGRALQYIGVRTLDIYLLHFLFLPNLPMVSQWCKTYKGNFVMETVVSWLLALLVIAFCILASNILRISPFLKKYLFGRK